MGGMISDIEAPTKTELRKLVQQWRGQVRAMGLEDIRLDYDPERIEKTPDGYKIRVWAHS